ncbi:MAG: cell division protein ZapA [Gammaproteobacteria bacterium]|nr:cell division protein ZapA [Gammaproteobacteria bacterium]
MKEDYITITICDQDYKIKCDESELELLNKSAAFLDIKMSEIKKVSPTMTKDKIAVMAALNIISLYLNKEEELQEFQNVSSEIESLQNSLKLEGFDE